MTEWTRALDGRGVEVAAVGGKAAAVDGLMAAQLPVPPAGVVTAAAYQEFVDRSGLERWLAELEEGDLPPPDRMDDAAAAVTERFLAAGMPDDIERQIVQLAEDLAGQGQLAVRSSATVEDAADASYAGQFESVLGVVPDDVGKAVLRVWASLWHPGVLAYRRAREASGDGSAAPAMAVLLMRMVDASHAGVSFTRDPGSAADQLRIEVVEGLAEGLVGGEETPVAWAVPRDAPAAGGPLGPADDRLAPVVAEVARLSLEAERVFGSPQDVEWAAEGDTVWLVQSRPITTLGDDVATSDQDAGGDDPAGMDDGFDTPGAGTWTRSGIGEMLPGVLSPLVWSITAPLVEHGFRQLFADLGALPADVRGPTTIVGRHRGRAALRLDILRRVAANLPGGSPEELERQYFGEVLSSAEELDELPSPSRWAGVVGTVRAIAVRRRVAVEAGVVTQAVDAVVAQRPLLASMSNRQLIDRHFRLLDVAGRAIANEVAVAAVAAATYRALELVLDRYLEGDSAGEAAQRVTAGRAPAGGAVAMQVCGLVRGGLADRDLAAALRRAADGQEFLDEVGATPQGRRFLNELYAAVRRAGSARVYAGATWEEQPHLAWRAFRQAMIRELKDPGGDQPAPGTPDPDNALREVEERVTRGWRWRLTRVVTGQVVDLRRRLLRRLAADAGDFLRMREEVKAAVLELGGEHRRILLSLGERLAADGVLDAAEDVEYLHHQELLAALAGEDVDARVLHQRRQAGERAADAGALPRRFEGRAPVAGGAAAEGDRLRGWGASPGRHRGRVAVVDDLSSASLDDGDVLVAETTDPSWTPLFLTAGAVVVEEGGPLSHAAIVARELGVPAVLNVPGVVAALRSAKDVTVDGSSGAIEVHDADEGDGGDGPPREEAA